MNRTAALSIFLSVSAFISCTSNEIGSAKDVNPETIYFDYRISGEEGNDYATVLLQYRFGGENGTTLTLDEGSKAELDGQQIPVDSARITGAYYELQKPVEQFAGKHTISFIGINKKKYDEEFSFQPFSLIGKMPDTLKRDSLVLQVKGLKDGDKISMVMTDTVFGSNGVERTVRINKGSLVITEEDLFKLANGPVQLDLSREEEMPVKNGTAEGGRIVVSYSLRREFWLKD